MYADAVGAYTRAIARTPHPTRTDWSLFYAQGAAYERVHDWARAEADMKRALQLDPNQAVVLNFLGFSWTEQNRNLSEAHDMIQRALDQRPNDGQIVDSLGWVDLRQGDVAQAVRLLEHAAELQPTDPTITGHLGDAYWEAGRHLEAEDQWRRALVEQPDPDDAARIEARLKSAGSE
jgi:Flp pilus assembly protein TadD